MFTAIQTSEAFLDKETVLCVPEHGKTQGVG